MVQPLAIKYLRRVIYWHEFDIQTPHWRYIIYILLLQAYDDAVLNSFVSRMYLCLWYWKHKNRKQPTYTLFLSKHWRVCLSFRDFLFDLLKKTMQNLVHAPSTLTRDLEISLRSQEKYHSAALPHDQPCPCSLVCLRVVSPPDFLQ